MHLQELKTASFITHKMIVGRYSFEIIIVQGDTNIFLNSVPIKTVSIKVLLKY